MNIFNMTNYFNLINIKVSLSMILISSFFFKMNAQSDADYHYYDNLLNSNSSIVDLSTPDVKQLQRHNLSSISEYSGKTNVSIPIFQIKAGGINYPISLNYNSGGIKIIEEATRVGLGWTLTNSFIVRKIIDGQDFDESGKTESEASNSPNSNSYLDRRIGYFKYKNQNAYVHKKLSKIDYLPDLYNIHIPSGTSSFYFENINQPKELTSNEIKISSTINIIDFRVVGQNGSLGSPEVTKDIFSFKITDNNGIVYDFNHYDVSSVLSYQPLQEIGLNVPYVSNWLISKITDPSTNKSVEFTYEDVISNIVRTESRSINRVMGQNAFESTNCFKNYVNLAGYNIPSTYKFAYKGGYNCYPEYNTMMHTTEYYKINRLKK